MLKDNDIEIYSKHNDEKSFALVWFISTLKNETYKKMTSI